MKYLEGFKDSAGILPVKEIDGVIHSASVPVEYIRPRNESVQVKLNEAQNCIFSGVE